MLQHVWTMFQSACVYAMPFCSLALAVLWILLVCMFDMTGNQGRLAVCGSSALISSLARYQTAPGGTSLDAEWGTAGLAATCRSSQGRSGESLAGAKENWEDIHVLLWSCFGPALVLSEREESVSRWESNGSCCLLLQSSKGLPCVTALQEAQLNDVLFELDRRAAKLLLKPLDVDFVDS